VLCWLFWGTKIQPREGLRFSKNGCARNKLIANRSTHYWRQLLTWHRGRHANEGQRTLFTISGITASLRLPLHAYRRRGHPTKSTIRFR